MRSFIDSHWTQDYGETSHALKRKKKIGLKLELGKCGENKVFLTFKLVSFIQIALKI